jgi:hypothetical protein
MGGRDGLRQPCGDEYRRATPDVVPGRSRHDRDFELCYLIQNPNSEPLTDEIEVTYLLPPPTQPVVRTYSMGTNARRNIPVHLEPNLENVEVPAIIRTPTSKPVVVERAWF